MMNLIKRDTRNTLFKGEDLTRFIVKLSQTGFARNVQKVNEAYQAFWKTLPNNRNRVDLVAKWGSPDDPLEKKWTELALYANDMYNLLIDFKDLADKSEENLKREGGNQNASKRLQRLCAVTKAVLDVHFCIVMEFQFCHDKLTNNRPRPAKELADVLKNHFSISHLRGIATIETLEQFTIDQEWFFINLAHVPIVKEFVEKSEKTMLFRGTSNNLKISQIAYFYSFSVFIKDLLNISDFPNNCRGLFEDLRICFQIVSTLLDRNRRVRRVTKTGADFSVRLGKKMEQLKNKVPSAAEELPSVKHQNYVSHCGLKKPLDVLIGDGKSQVEIRAAMVLIDNGLVIMNLGSDLYKSNFDSFMKEIEPEKGSSNAPSNRADPFFFFPFPFHIKAKGSNSLTITDMCGVRSNFNKKCQGPVNILFPEEPPEMGRRIVGDDNDASRDQWMGWMQAAMLLRAREVTKVCAFMPYRGDFRTNMTARLDLSNSQIEFVTNKWIEDCSQLFGIKRRGAFLYPGYRSEHLRDTYDPQNTDFQRRKWFHEDFETWIHMFEDLNKLEVDGNLEAVKPNFYQM